MSPATAWAARLCSMTTGSGGLSSRAAGFGANASWSWDRWKAATPTCCPERERLPSRSIESNTIAFLKCLIAQNALKFNAEFILGDFRPYLDTCTDTYDLLVASGVLYHMLEPVKLLQDMAKVSRAIGVWTHYYDPDVILKRDHLKNRFDSHALVQILAAAR